MKRLFLLALCTLTALAGCASVDINDYRANQPVLDVATFFSGTIDGWGMVQDRAGKVQRRFYVQIDAKWNGDHGTLDEHFRYDDGKLQQRVWTIVKSGDHYVGTAGDIVGEAEGTASGNALHWNYVLALPIDDKVWNIDMDDWMYLIDDRTLLNHTGMSKLGVHVGDVTLAMRKR
jgi:hypothetical protein